jgi:putative glutamine amidotransferase
MKLHIGLSYAPESNPKSQKYSDALRKAGEVLNHEILISDLSTHPELIFDIDGIVFTGGVDVDPMRYNKPELCIQCEEIDDARDSNEFQLAKKADELELPIFGICRGLQLLNVYYGGSLISDLETAGKSSHKKIDGKDRRHNVHLEPGKLVKKISRITDGNVTSAHHQAIDELAPGMTISAKSSADDVIEAIEWNDQSGKPYFLAVQWHPERMQYDEPLSGALFESFLWEVAAQKMLSGRMRKQDADSSAS